MNSIKVKYPIIFGSFISSMLTYLELRYEENYYWHFDIYTVVAILAMILCQLTFIVFMIYAGFYGLEHLKELRKHGDHLKNIEKVGLVFQLISLLLIVMSFCIPDLPSVIFIPGILLICIGIYQHRCKQSALSISFMLWGIALIVLLYVFPDILPVSMESFDTWE